MNRSLLFASYVLCFALASCGGTVSSNISREPSSTESNTLTYEINISHWQAARADGSFEARYLMQDIFFPSFLKNEIDLSHVIAGDTLTLTFTGDWRVLETYPAMFIIDEGAFIKAELAKAEIVEVPVIDGKIVAPEGVSLAKMDVEQAVVEDGELLPLSGFTKGYLSVSALDKAEGRALYAFDPREAEYASVCGYDLGKGSYNGDWCK